MSHSSDDFRTAPGARISGLTDDPTTTLGLPQVSNDSRKAFPPTMKFSEAATEWLHQRSDYLKPRTFKTYRLETAALTLVFKERRLCAINNQDIREYQRRRTAGLKPFKFRRNPHDVNNEVRTLQHILPAQIFGICWPATMSD